MQPRPKADSSHAPWNDAGPHWEELQAGLPEDKDLRRLHQSAGWEELRKLRRLHQLTLVGIYPMFIATLVLAPWLGWFWFISLTPAGVCCFLSHLALQSIKAWRCPLCRSYFFAQKLFDNDRHRYFFQSRCDACEAESSTPAG